MLIAPDSFKGSAMSTEISEWIAQGWREARPQDELILHPMADGGEGTLRAIERSRSDITKITQSVMGPDNRSHNALWFLTDSGTAFVELANICGLTLLEEPNPLGAHTFGLGQILYDISRDDEVKQVVIALGGSASTDAGTGALRALGFRFLDEAGRDIPLGGGGLREIARVDASAAVEPPVGGVICLVDVDNPLLGNRGSAAVFAPQKGASKDEVEVLDQALTAFQRVVGHPDGAGAGAAGGVAYGLQALWGARITSGARVLSQMTGLPEEIAQADFIITGEGSLDEQSFSGKVIGTLFELKAEFANESAQLAVIAGAVKLSLQQLELLKGEGLFAAVELIERADSLAAAIADVKVLTISAARDLASRVSEAKLSS